MELPDTEGTVKTFGLVWATKGVNGHCAEKNNPKVKKASFKQVAPEMKINFLIKHARNISLKIQYVFLGAPPPDRIY